MLERRGVRNKADLSRANRSTHADLLLGRNYLRRGQTRTRSHLFGPRKYTVNKRLRGGRRVKALVDKDRYHRRASRDTFRKRVDGISVKTTKAKKGGGGGGKGTSRVFETTTALLYNLIQQNVRTRSVSPIAG